MTFTLNQTVKGAHFGTFVILAFRDVVGSSERYAQLKEVCPITGRGRPGTIVLPLSALRPM